MEGAALGPFERAALEREAVERRRTLEGEGFGGPSGGLEIGASCLLQLPCPVEVNAQGLGVGLPRGFEHSRQPTMVIAQDGRRQVRQNRLANPVVIRFDLFTGRRTGASNQAARPEYSHRPTLVLKPFRALAGVCLPKRPAGDCDDFEESPGVVGQAGDSPPENLVESDPSGRAGTVRGVGLDLDMPRQLGDEERVAARFAGDRIGLSVPNVRLGTEQRQGEVAGLARRECFDGQFAAIER